MALDGTWNVTLSTPMGERGGTLTLATSGATLSGRFSGPQGEQAFDDGKVDGSAFSWSATVAGPMGDLKLDWAGSATSDDAIEGTVQFGSFGSGRFTGTRA